MRNPKEHHRGFLRVTMASATVLMLSLSSLRAEWIEPAFAPPIGSRWIVEEASDSLAKPPEGGEVTKATRVTGEVVFKEKLADGYRLSYVIKDMVVEGSAPSVAVLAPALTSMKNIVVEGMVDARGKPVRIDNLDEVNTQNRAVIEELAKKFEDRPQVAQFMRQIMADALVKTGQDAAVTNLTWLDLISVAHGTGLKPGEERTADSAKPSPFGGEPLRSITTLTLTAVDETTGNATYRLTEVFDPESTKAMIKLVAGRMIDATGTAAAGLNKSDVERMTSMLEIEFHSDTIFKVEKGMVRSLESNTVNGISAMGHSGREESRHRITIRPLIP